jgi:hypothetical protein
MNRLFSRFPGMEVILWAVASIVAFAAFLLLAPNFLSATAANNPTNTPAPQAAVQPAPSLTPPPLATPVPPFAPAPVVHAIVPVPAPGPKAQVMTFAADPANSGWVRGGESQPHWGDRNLNVGAFKGQSYQGLLYFDLATLAPGTKISFADIQIIGLDREHLGPLGSCQLRMLRPDIVTNWSKLTSQELSQAPVLTDVGSSTQPQDLAVGTINQFIFTPEQAAYLEQAIDGKGLVAFRLDGPTGARDSLFSWDAGGLDAKAGVRPVLHIVGVPGEFVSVTLTPTPQNIITAAAQAQTAVAKATRIGTPTPFPRNYATATPFVVVTPEATPANQQTVVALKALATAVALTTGTYTPTPANVATAFPSPTPVYIPLGTLTPFATATPIPGPAQAVRTPVPDEIKGNIIFMSDHFGLKLPLVMKPDGTLLQALSGIDLYNAAHARDQYSPDHSHQVVLTNDSANQLQIWIQDVASGQLTLVTHLASGKNLLAYDPAWSPDGSKIVYSSNETGPTELYVYDLNTKVSKRITTSPAAVYNQRPSWSPDSKRIAFKSNQSGPFQIWVVDADGSNLHNVSNSPYNDTDPVWAK